MFDNHPGGNIILEITKGSSEDITAMFEMHHNFANIKELRQQLQ